MTFFQFLSTYIKFLLLLFNTFLKQNSNISLFQKVWQMLYTRQNSVCNFLYVYNNSEYSFDSFEKTPECGLFPYPPADLNYRFIVVNTYGNAQALVFHYEFHNVLFSVFLQSFTIETASLISLICSSPNVSSISNNAHVFLASCICVLVPQILRPSQSCQLSIIYVFSGSHIFVLLIPHIVLH